MLSFSIITPSLNQGRFIERTLRSVLDQGYPAFEYVVCDGGSSDATPSILARFGKLSVVSEADLGQADAVNKGIRRTSGDIIGWLNSDDVYAPGALATVAEFLAAHPAVDVVYGDAQLLDADDAVLGDYYTEPWDPDRLTERCILAQPAVFFRRRAVERFGFLDASLRYCMDYEYWLRLAADGAVFAYLPVRLAGARLHAETKTFSARLAVHAEINAVLRNRLGRVPNSWLINHAHTLVELRRAQSGPRLRLPYALEVVAEAIGLSRRWNRRVPPGLLAAALGPVAKGARRRLFQSRSAATSRPAS